MTKKRSLTRVALGLIATLCALVIFTVGAQMSQIPQCIPSASSDGEKITLFLTEEEGTLSIVKDEKSDYTIIFSTDTILLDSELSGRVQMLINDKGARTDVTPDSIATKHSPYEILIGQTNRDESAQLLAALEDQCTLSDDLAWGYAVIGEKLLFLANSSLAFEIGMTEFVDYLTECDLAPARDLYVIKVKSIGEYEEEKRAEAQANKKERIEWLKNEIASFDDSLFGEREAMPTDVYNDPYTYPTEGQHPRLNLTADMLPDIKALLENPDYKELSDSFWKLANTDFDGILPDVSTLTKTYNWTGESAAIIEAKALAYLLTGDELYGYEAIYAAKNHMLTLEISHDIATDIFRIYGWSMMVTGEVYDWCYDLMTELDKSQFVRGVQKYYCEDCPCGQTDKMTIGFPPTGQTAIAGHGTNVALQRDYVAFSIAIFDEYPDWWDLVGGRFYEEYVPANNVFYAAGMNTQGTNNYVWGKFYAQLYSAWLIKVMSGEMPYDPGIENVVYGLMGLRLPNGKVFQSGDGSATASGHSDSISWAIYLAQALFPSEVMQRNARIKTNNYTLFRYDNGNFITPTTSLIFRSNGMKDEAEGDLNDDLKLIWYYGSPMGLMTARDSWTESAAAVYMKVGELSGTNHDHQDAGTFQIYYKGALTSESGQYGTGAGYGTAHWKMWHQATISHNGLLVYNPSLADATPIFANDGSVSNDSRFFYSGSQLMRSSTGNNVAQWTDGRADTGVITGHDYYYDPTDGSVKYAYLAGDISVAYSSATVETIERRMIAVYTNSEDFPMFFTVYDYMKSQDASFTKSFLMHTPTEPVVNGNTAYFEQGDGRIVLTTLTDDAVIKTYGGVGKTYWVNDVAGNLNIAEAAGGTGADKGDKDTISDGALWGRVQIDNVGKLEDHLLNVIYVTDATNEASITPKKFENDNVIGMQLENVIVAYSKTAVKNRAEIEFTTEGNGLREYYFSGLSAGSWTVKIDGVTVAHAYTEMENGLVAFTAPTGTVTLIPGSDVRPANSDDIKYYTNGAAMPEDIQYFYVHDVEYVLPELESTPENQFAGWYATETSSERIYTIPAGTRGTVKLYARFYRSYTEDYETTEVNLIESEKTLNNFLYRANGKTGASFTTVTDEEKNNTYLLWRCGEKDPQFDLKVKMSSLLADKSAVTFSIDVALDADHPAISSNFRLRGDHSSKSASVFATAKDGSVYLTGDSSYKVAQLTNEFQTLIFSVDFEKGIIYAFSTNGNIIAQKSFTIPSAFVQAFTEGEPTHMDYMRGLDYIFDWYTGKQATADSALRIDNISVTIGLPKNANIPDGDAPNAIIYHNLDNAEVPPELRYTYSYTEETPLPETLASRSSATFGGWYSDSTFTNRITAVPAGGTEQFHVYVKWNNTVEESYTGADIDVYYGAEGTAGKDVTYNGIKYGFSAKEGSGYKTVQDGSGNTYLEWKGGTQDPQFSGVGSLKSVLLGNTAVTYSVKIARDPNKAVNTTEFRVQENGSKCFTVFGTDADGNVYLAGKKNLKICSLGESFTEITVTVDFALGTITAYNLDGTVATNPDTGVQLVASVAKPSASEATDLVDFISYTKYIFMWRTSSNANSPDRVIYIDDIKVMTGVYGATDTDQPNNTIVYKNLVDSQIPGDAPTVYDPTANTLLPEDVTGVSNKEFAGWYSDAALTQRITSIPKDTSGTVTVYAKWHSVFVEDYENTALDIFNENDATDGMNVTKNGMTYKASGKNLAGYKTLEDEDGNSYLMWTGGSEDPQINKSGALADFLGSDTAFTFSIDLAKYADKPMLTTSLYIRVLSSNKFTALTISSKGKVYLGTSASGIHIGTVSDEFSTFTISFDFETAMLRAHNPDGSIMKIGDTLCEIEVPVPKDSDAQSMLEWLPTIRNYNFILYSDKSSDPTACTLIDNITLKGGIPSAS